jgi:hypothetical protein
VTPTTTPTSPTSTPAVTTVSPDNGRTVPAFLTGRKLAPALRQQAYREVIRFAGAGTKVRVRNLPHGLSWAQRDGRIILRGQPQRRGEADVVVLLADQDDVVRRTFHLRVR